MSRYNAQINVDIITRTGIIESMQYVIDEYLQNLLDAKSNKKLSRNALAKKAGLRESTLRFLGGSEWNPTVDTLRKLEEGLND